MIRSIHLSIYLLTIIHNMVNAQSGLNILHGSPVNQQGIVTIGPEDNFHIAISNLDIQSKAKVGAHYGRLNLNYFGGDVVVGGSNAQTRLSIGPGLPLTTLHVRGNSEASLGTNGYVILGNTLLENLVMDNNEIQARKANQAAPLYLNEHGGGLYSNLTAIGNKKTMKYDTQTGEIGFDNSSRRYKRRITTFSEDWTKLLKVRPVKYTREKSGDRWEYGYIAEEMDSIGLRVLVGYDGQGLPDDVKYDRMVLYLTELVKSHQRKISEMDKELSVLRDQVEEFRTVSNNCRPKEEP